MKFNSKVLMIGYGSVAKCALPILLRHIKIPCQNITLVDFLETAEAAREWTEQGIRFVQERITPGNLHEMLAKHTGAGGLIIDLAWNIDSVELIQWCHDHDVLYINTSLEVWEPYADIRTLTLLEKLLYARHRHTAQWNDDTATVVRGQSRSVSHFTRQVMALHRLRQPSLTREEGAELEKLLARRDFARLAIRLGVKTIHCSERDTQITNTPKEVDEFATHGALRDFERKRSRQQNWAGERMRIRPRFRPFFLTKCLDIRFSLRRWA